MSSLAGNIAIGMDDDWKPSKKRRPEWIDGIVSQIMGLDRPNREDHRSFYSYNFRGSLVI